MMCQACTIGDHANCGCQTWCDCECDPAQAEPFTPIEEFEDEPNEGPDPGDDEDYLMDDLYGGL